MEARLTGRSLSSRLRAVADAIPPRARVADVGTDHAQLLAWLRRAGRIDRAIGIDVVSGPLRQAQRTLDAAGTPDVELRCGDGLTPLRPGEVDTAVLAGMGGPKIIELVDAAPAVVDGLQTLVLQPNTDWTAVRRWIAGHRWPLRDEQLVEDRGKFYVVLVVRPRPQVDPGWTDDELVLGPRLLREPTPVFSRWLRHELGRTERALTRATPAEGGGAPHVVDLREHAQRLRRALSPRYGECSRSH